MAVNFEYYAGELTCPWNREDVFYSNDVLSIYCLTLECRPDRRKLAECVFNRLKIPVNWAVATKHPEGGLKGCFTSHMAIINDAYNRGAKNVLIFEDDVTETIYYDTAYISQAVDFIYKDCYDVFFFGPMANILTEKTRYVNGNIYNLKSKCGHAYSLSRSMMEKIKDLKFTGNGLDMLLKYNQESYSITPIQFIQNEYSSDNTTSERAFNYEKIANGKTVDFFKRMIQYMNEWYSLNINIPIKNLNTYLIILLGIIFLFYRHQTVIFVIVFVITLITVFLASTSI